MSTTTGPQGASDPAQEPTAGDALATWAETHAEINPDGPHSRFAEPSDEAGRTMLEEALGGPAALRRALGGRPTLDPAGAKSRERKVRLAPPLDRRAEAAVQAGAAPDFSALMRTALAEYLDRHEHQASA
ncbi:MAG: hypothetical protein DLM56_07205 [Pseudonocardiales bacterium]|nr:MAG: hypothetical protein DLM56_07205 [Pseudonocardiales bacterium]